MKGYFKNMENKGEEGSKDNPIVPKTIAGMLPSARYAQLRKMGVKVEEIAALCVMHERGQYPGNRLFVAKKKKEILSLEYKKLRKKTEKEIRAKFREMQAEWLVTLRAAKAKLEAEGVDFKKEAEKAKIRGKKITEVVKKEVKKSRGS